MITTNDGAGTEREPQKYEDKVKYVNAIAQPLASKKLNKRIIKLLKAALPDKKKNNVRIGIKDTQRRVMKGETGIVVFAGDVSPIDIMVHMPGVCEEKGIPYIYIPLQLDLANHVGFTNSCLMVLVKESPDYKELYDDVYQEIKKLNMLL